MMRVQEKDIAYTKLVAKVRQHTMLVV
jgi:hypothetical protein